MSEEEKWFKGKTFKDLEIIYKKDLGKGGYASVKLGRLRPNPTLFAIKIVLSPK
jgi:hypothetical protein